MRSVDGVKRAAKQEHPRRVCPAGQIIEPRDHGDWMCCLCAHGVGCLRAERVWACRRDEIVARDQPFAAKIGYHLPGGPVV